LIDNGAPFEWPVAACGCGAQITSRKSKGEIMPLRCTPPSVSSWINRLAVALPGALNSLSPDEDLQKFAKI
jgi:hypothetical protein